MKNSIGKLCYFLPAIALLLSAASCREEPIPENGSNTEPGKEVPDDMIVKFSIGGAETKAASSISRVCTTMDPIDLSEASGIEGLTLTETVTALDDVYAPVTKGTPIFTENLAQFGIDLQVSAYTDGEDFENWGNKDVAYKYDDAEKVWWHNYSEGTADGNLRWPDNNTLIFAIKTPDSPGYTYSYSTNSVTVGSVTGTGVGTLSVTDYCTPKDETDEGNDAEYQNDILYSTKKMVKDQENNKVLLYHALTGVKFKINNTKNDSGVKITGISRVEFKNLISEGSFTVKPAYEGYKTGSNADDAYPNSAKVVTWDPSTVRGNFSQNFDDDEQNVNLSSEGSKYDFPGTFDNAAANLNNLNDADASKTFFFIPQTISNVVTLTVTYNYTVNDGDTKTATTDIAFGQAVTKGNAKYEWLPGQLRTYTLNVGDDLTISITDEITNKTKKSGLTITNTNTATCYIRVAVIGNWLTDAGTKDIHGDDAPIAITPCEQSLIVSLVNSNKQNGWVKGEDNFFYYLYPLAGGKVIKPDNTLFGTLDFTDFCTFGGSGTKPYKDCHLEVTVAAQAVLATEAPNIWPSAIASQLKNETRD